MANKLLQSLVLRGVVRLDVLASLYLGTGSAKRPASGFDNSNRHPLPNGRPAPEAMEDTTSTGVQPGTGRSRRPSVVAACLGRTTSASAAFGRSRIAAIAAGTGR